MKRRIICKGCGKIALEGWPNTDEIVHSCDCGNNALLVNTGYFRWIALRDGSKRWDEWNPEKALVTVKKENEKRRGNEMLYEVEHGSYDRRGKYTEYRLTDDGMWLHQAIKFAVLDHACCNGIPVEVVWQGGVGKMFVKVASVNKNDASVNFIMPMTQQEFTIRFLDISQVMQGRVFPKVYLEGNAETHPQYISAAEVKVLEYYGLM